MRLPLTENLTWLVLCTWSSHRVDLIDDAFKGMWKLQLCIICVCSSCYLVCIFYSFRKTLFLLSEFSVCFEFWIQCHLYTLLGAKINWLNDWQTGWLTDWMTDLHSWKIWLTLLYAFGEDPDTRNGVKI